MSSQSRGVPAWLRSAKEALAAIRGETEIRIASRNDPQLLETIRAAAPYTMVGKRRLLNACLSVEEVYRRGIAGAIVECGVWRGGCAAAMAAVSKRRGGTRAIWLFDSFEGLPEPGANDGIRAREWMESATADQRCVAEVHQVEGLLFDNFHVPRESVHIRRGWFAETVPAAVAEIGPIAVLRLDADWYESTRICLDHLYPNVSDGGIVIIDDYGYWEGCRRATDELLRSIGPVELTWIDGCGVFFRKTPSEKATQTCAV